MDFTEVILYDAGRDLWVKITKNKLYCNRGGERSPWHLAQENPTGTWSEDGLRFRHSRGFIKWIGGDKWVEKQQEWTTSFIEVSRTTIGGKDIRNSKNEYLLNNIEIIEEIGGGFFGTVYRGLWQASTPVALKTIRKTEQVDAWQDEMKLLSNLRHPNIVQYYGNYKNDGKDYIVTEFLPLGSVKDFLIKEGTNISVEDILKMARGTAAGMLYLSENGIIHRDLGARNLLAKKVESSYTAQVADFGMSRQLHGNEAYEASAKIFAINWSAPEVVTSQSFSVASDVWSFAVTLWEMLEYGKIPFYELGSNREAISNRIISINMLSQPNNCPDHLFDLMKRCWQLSPAKRPSFKQIFDELNAQTISPATLPPSSFEQSKVVGYYADYTNNANFVSNLPKD